MGYSEKLQKLCVLRGLDQAALATRLGLSKSSISRILSGLQEPKLSLAKDLAQVLGVTLEYLVNDEVEWDATHHLVMVSDEELMILKIVRKLGAGAAIDRLLYKAAGWESSAAPDLSPPGGAAPAEIRSEMETPPARPAPDVGPPLPAHGRSKSSRRSS